MKRNRDKIWKHLHDEDALNEPDVIEYEDEFFYSEPEDPYDRLMLAESLAEELGYYESYLDGAFVTHEWILAMYNEINKLVGSPWPIEVLKIYDLGYDNGWLDT